MDREEHVGRRGVVVEAMVDEVQMALVSPMGHRIVQNLGRGADGISGLLVALL